MPKSKPRPHHIRRQGGRLVAGTVQPDPNGTRAQRRAAARAGMDVPVKLEPEGKP